MSINLNIDTTVINHSRLEEMAAHFMRNGKPMIVYGPTGIGKSETIRRVAERKAAEMGLNFKAWNELTADDKTACLKTEVVKNSFIFADMRMCQMEGIDLRGLMQLGSDHTHMLAALAANKDVDAAQLISLTSDAGYTKYVPQLLFKVLSNKEAKGVLFLDEINLSDLSVLKASYQLILDHSVGELTLSRGVSIFAAGNRSQDCADVTQLPQPLNTRFCNVELRPPTSEEWVSNYAIPNKLDSRIIAYLCFRKDVIAALTEESRRTRTFPCPRTWKTASDNIQGVRPTGPETDKDFSFMEDLVGSAVGPAAAREFIAFQQIQQDRPLLDYLKNPELVRELQNSDNLDKMYNLLSNVAIWWADNMKQPKSLESVAAVCEVLNPEYGVLLMRLCRAQNESEYQKQMKSSNRCMQLLGVYAPYLVDMKTK
jgi:hypothetical protein